MGKSQKKKFMQGKMQRKGKGKKFLQKEGPIVIFIWYIKSANKHVKMELTDLRDSHCVSVVLIKSLFSFAFTSMSVKRFSFCIRDSSILIKM